LGVEDCGKSPTHPPKQEENHPKVFTFSTFFSTEKTVKTLDLTGFSPVFDRLFFPHSPPKNQRQTAGFSGGVSAPAGGVFSGRRRREFLLPPGCFFFKKMGKN